MCQTCIKVPKTFEYTAIIQKIITAFLSISEWYYYYYWTRHLYGVRICYPLSFMTFYLLEVKLLRFKCQYVLVIGAKVAYEQRANKIMRRLIDRRLWLII